jgi:hypothetical protein
MDSKFICRSNGQRLVVPNYGRGVIPTRKYFFMNEFLLIQVIYRRNIIKKQTVAESAVGSEMSLQL